MNKVPFFATKPKVLNTNLSNSRDTPDHQLPYVKIATSITFADHIEFDGVSGLERSIVGTIQLKYSIRTIVRIKKNDNTDWEVDSWQDICGVFRISSFLSTNQHGLLST